MKLCYPGHVEKTIPEQFETNFILHYTYQTLITMHDEIIEI